MKTLIVLCLAAASCSQAGVLTVLTYPLRHPVRTAKVITYPVRHPIKTIR